MTNEQLVLKYLKEEPLRTKDLISIIIENTEVTEEEVRAAVWRLLSKNELSVDIDWKLKVRI